MIQPWTRVALKKHQRPETLQQSVVAAVYVDQALKKRHETSLVITGLQPSNSQSDANLFSAVCNAELHVQPNIVITKRFGKPANGKVQPLLVVLKHVEETRKVLSMAKTLRRSTDDAIRKGLYINPYMTRAEAAAAYQVRVQRRLKAQQHTLQTAGSRGGATASNSSDNEQTAIDISLSLMSVARNPNAFVPFQPTVDARASFNGSAVPTTATTSSAADESCQPGRHGYE